MGRDSRKAPRFAKGKPHKRRKINEQGLWTRRGVAHDDPRLGAFNGLTMQVNEDHQTLRYNNASVRGPCPTKYAISLPPSSAFGLPR